MPFMIEKIKGLCYSFNMQQFFSGYLVLVVKSMCPRSIGEHEETEEDTAQRKLKSQINEEEGSKRTSQHRGS